ncbi:hypothetical protein SOVF_031490 [Spinacia oleracea]|nr:hypothetical protein SOVF_031490 [Spinacia oleracea]
MFYSVPIYDMSLVNGQRDCLCSRPASYGDDQAAQHHELALPTRD